MSARQIVGWLLIVLLVLFVAFNLDRARIWFFGIRVEMPISLAVLFSAGLGAGAAILFQRLRRR
ncbi:MAG: hypothetical protein IPK67_05655 [Planctomycetes bacterium]|jgi:uncharacterized integral membrane protein|nr:hypothetical protein [Planctomycetota bacterium]